jgi:cell division septation protein DedD
MMTKYLFLIVLSAFVVAIPLSGQSRAARDSVDRFDLSVVDERISTLEKRKGQLATKENPQPEINAQIQDLTKDINLLHNNKAMLNQFFILNHDKSITTNYDDWQRFTNLANVLLVFLNGGSRNEAALTLRNYSDSTLLVLEDVALYIRTNKDAALHQIDISKIESSIGKDKLDRTMRIGDKIVVPVDKARVAASFITDIVTSHQLTTFPELMRSNVPAVIPRPTDEKTQPPINKNEASITSTIGVAGPTSGSYYVQIAIVNNREVANRLVVNLKNKMNFNTNFETVRSALGVERYAIMANFATLNEASRAITILKQRGREFGLSNNDFFIRRR